MNRRRGAKRGNRGRQKGGEAVRLPSTKEDLESLERAVLKVDREKRKILKLLAKLTNLENEAASGKKKMDANQMTLVENGRRKRREHAARLEELDIARNGLILSTTPEVREKFGCCGNCGSISHKTRTCPRPQSLAMKNQRVGFVHQKKQQQSSSGRADTIISSQTSIKSGACQICGSTSHKTKSCPRPPPGQLQERQKRMNVPFPKATKDTEREQEWETGIRVRGREKDSQG